MEYKFVVIMLVVFILNYHFNYHRNKVTYDSNIIQISQTPHWEIAPNRYSYDNGDPNTGRCIKQGRSKLYTWVDDSLPFKDFSKEAFCNTKYNNLLFIGDSTTHGMFMSLSLLLGVDYRKIAGIKVRFYTNVNACGKNITFIRNDDLAEHKCFISKKRVCKPFIEEMKQKDLIIANRGVHYSPLNDVLRDLDIFFKLVKSDQRIIYRETVGGHPNCDKKTEPDKYYDPQYSKQQKSWHWDLMDQQNRDVNTYIEKYYPHVEILRISKMTQLRSDMHIGAGDCLHYCLPGPVDHWNRMLLIKIYN